MAAEEIATILRETAAPHSSVMIESIMIEAAIMGSIEASVSREAVRSGMIGMKRTIVITGTIAATIATSSNGPVIRSAPGSTMMIATEGTIIAIAMIEGGEAQGATENYNENARAAATALFYCG
jgi:hypothetical protein